MEFTSLLYIFSPTRAHMLVIVMARTAEKYADLHSCASLSDMPTQVVKTIH